jgi:diguanylate cyclase (GGDEF)-like protein/PAS domain S-box-containing protein
MISQQHVIGTDAFRATLDLTLDAVFFFDATSLRFTYVNQGAVDQTGYRREKLLSLHPYDIKPEYPEPRFRELIAPLLSGAQESLRFETLHRTRDRGDIPVEIFLQYVIPVGEAPRFVAITHEITSRHQAKQILMKALEELSGSEQRQMELLQLAQREHGRLMALLSAMNPGILFADLEGRVEYINPAFRCMWGIEDDIELIGRSTREVLRHATANPLLPDPSAPGTMEVADPQHDSEPMELKLQDGRTFTRRSYPVKQQLGSLIGRLWLFEDITRERQTAEQLTYLAEHDALTGLYNRRRFQEHLERMISNARRSGASFALLYFDLNKFKPINDRFGHRAGDMVLVRISEAVAALVRSGAMLARLGGDEFAILSELSTEEEPVQLAARIADAVAAIPFSFADKPVRVSVSIGIALFPRDGVDADELVAHADDAMYQAKDLVGQDWAIYHPEPHDSGRDGG